MRNCTNNKKRGGGCYSHHRPGYFTVDERVVIRDFVNLRVLTERYYSATTRREVYTSRPARNVIKYTPCGSALTSRSVRPAGKP